MLTEKLGLSCNQRGIEVDGFARARAKRLEPKESKELEGKIVSIDKDLLGLKSQERALQALKRELEEKASVMKDTLVTSAYFSGSEFEIPFPKDERCTEINLEEQFSKAISVFPYLSEALSKRKPFEIRESVMHLAGKT